MNYHITFLLIFFLSQFSYGQIEKGDFILSVSGSISFNKGLQKADDTPYKANEVNRDQKNLGWSSNTSIVYVISDHFLAGLSFSYSGEKSKDQYSSFIFPANSNNPKQGVPNYYIYHNYRDHFRIGPSISWVSGFRFHTGFIISAIPYIQYSRNSGTFESNTEYSKYGSRDYYYGLVVSPSILYQITDNIYLDFSPLKISYEHPLNNGDSRQLGLNAVFTAISFGVKFKL